MPVISKRSDSYLEKPCARCGSKKRISKKWKEKIPTFSGKITIVDFSQIVCTNKVCQVAFDKELIEEAKKREILKLKKEEHDAQRKANSLQQANKARKSKSRI